jgi:hypothetical protein
LFRSGGELFRGDRATKQSGKCESCATVTMSRPQSPEAEERHVLDATARSLPPMSAGISAISHAEHYSPFTIENGRDLVANAGPLENDKGVRGRTDIDFARTRARLEYRMAEAALGMSLVEHRQKHGEVPAAIEVVVEMQPI